MELSGILDTVTADLFKTALALFINGHRERIKRGVPLLICMSEVEIIDCDGVGALIIGHNLAAGLAGGRPVHVVASKIVARMLRITNTDRVLHVHNNFKTALSAIGADSDDRYYKNPCAWYI